MSNRRREWIFIDCWILLHGGRLQVHSGRLMRVLSTLLTVYLEGLDIAEIFDDVIALPRVGRVVLWLFLVLPRMD